ncbi:hypothetical protein BGZ60DRAFT_533064 [Tricladium varicosporioides]|nr:hypothetical protein BGZ60DRAFT_533064 [Hymenoscyphus varicosporioides]
MAILRSNAKAKTSQSGTTITTIAPVASPHSESPSECRQTSSTVVDLPSGAAPFKDQHTLEGSPEDRQPEKDPTMDPPAGEGPKDPPAVESSSENQQNTECPSEDRRLAEDLTVIPPAGEALSKVPPTGDSSTIPPALENPFKDQATVNDPPEDQEPAEDSTTDLPVGETLKDLPAVDGLPKSQPTTETPPEDGQPSEGLTVIPLASEPPSDPPPQLGGPSKGQLTTEIRAGDRQAAEGPTTNLQAGKAPDDLPALESLLDSQSIAEGPTTYLPEEEIPKEPTESSSQDRSTVERLSEDPAVESLSIMTPAAEALLNSENLSSFYLPDVPTANLDQELQKGTPLNPPSSNTIREAFQHINHKADGQKPNGVSSRESVLSKVMENTVICLDSEDEIEILPSRPVHDRLPKRKASSSPELQIVRGEYNNERMPRKRRKHTEKRTNLPAPALLSSPEGSTKASEDESRSRRKAHPHYKFSGRDLSKHMDDEARWFEAISKRCDDLTKLVTEQTQCIESFETLDFECCGIIAELSANSVPRNKRMQIVKQLADMEEKRRTKSAELRQTAFSTIKEGTLIKQDLTSWYAKEQKVTERIKNSR